MPGPLGTIAPTTDPNWAWDTPGWTNQGNLGGDVEGQNLSPALLATNSFLNEPEGLSGFVSRSIDPAVNSAVVKGTGVATFTTAVLYLAAMEVLAPAVTKQVVVSVGTVGGTSTTLLGLYNSTGSLVASTVSIPTIPATTIARSWVTPAVLAPGIYYGAWLNMTAASGAVPFANATSTEQLMLAGTTFPGTTFRFFSTGTGLTTVLPPLLASGFTGAGTVAATNFAWFMGIA